MELAVNIKSKSGKIDLATSRSQIESQRDAILSTGAIPAITALMPLEGVNAITKFGWNMPPLKELEPIPETKQCYIMLVSDGRCMLIHNRISTALPKKPGVAPKLAADRQ